MSDHERIGPMLASHERAWSLKATEHEEAAERARAEKKRACSAPLMPDETRRRTEMHHDAVIAQHEGQARVHRRRADMAAAGFLLSGPDEQRDAEYQRHHSELIAMAHRTGRARHSAESVG